MQVDGGGGPELHVHNPSSLALLLLADNADRMAPNAHQDGKKALSKPNEAEKPEILPPKCQVPVSTFMQRLSPSRLTRGLEL